MGRLIVITSGKGGVGKTTSAINIGAALNYLKEDVLLVDGNLTTPNIALHLGAPTVPITLNHVLLGKARLADAIYKHESGMKIMPASLSIKELDKIKHEKFHELTKKLKKVSDYVIFDSAAGLGKEALTTLEIADEVIIVTNPDILSVTDALKTAKIAGSMNKIVNGVILARVKNAKTEMPISSVREMLEAPIIGIVPEDFAVQKSLVMKDAVVHTHPKSKAAKSYIEVAAKIAGIELKEKGFFARIFGKSK